MAYGLKYQSDFYNSPPFRTAISVKIYREDYVGDVINVRTSEVSIEYNYVDDNTPIIGKGAKVTVYAPSGDMSFLEDLLLSYEKQFLCTIEYGGVIVFRGYSVCDLNERQLLPYALITLNFTDYLRRTEVKHTTMLQPIGGISNLMTLVSALLTETELDFPLLVNSTLFEDSMDMGDDETFLPQLFVQNSIFYRDNFDYDSIYVAINKALSAFNAFIYSFNDRFIIERQEDITRDGNWVLYDSLEVDSSGRSGTVVPSLRQSINKQAGDFRYVKMSQVIEYNSGLNTLVLRLMDKKLDTLVFNDWPDASSIYKISTCPPLAGTLQYRTWYIHEDFINITVGADRNDLSQWIRYTPTEPFTNGLCYSFAIYFNKNVDDDTILTIAYSQSTDMDVSEMYHIGMYYFLRIDGGPYSDWFLSMSGPKTRDDIYGQSGKVGLNLIGPNSAWYNHTAFNYQIVSLTDEKETKWNLNHEFNLSKLELREYNTPAGLYTVLPGGLHEALGSPEFQKLTITFCSPQYTVRKALKRIWQYPNLFASNVYTGDIVASISAEEIDNKITYVLNRDFIKIEEVDLHLFDLENLNYSNALLELDGFTRTNRWTSENSTLPIPLYEVFAKCKFRKYGRTIHNLKATIICDHVLKPFCLLTDNTIRNTNNEVITFLINGYTWDLVNATYDIDAEEYTEEEVIVDGVTYDSSGEQEGEDTPPEDAPYVYSISRMRMLLDIVVLKWHPVTGGITGYIVQRNPRYQVVTNTMVDGWTSIYKGTKTTAIESIKGAPFVKDTPIYYRVCAYNEAGNGPWSNVVQIIY